MRTSRLTAAIPRHFRRSAIAVGIAFGASFSAQAINIDTGNPDLVLRWDNTVRYNLGYRVEDIDPAIGDSPVSD